jgi:protein-S-isoprenylcysteine O-methyltransferase Ste14
MAPRVTSIASFIITIIAPPLLQVDSITTYLVANVLLLGTTSVAFVSKFNSRGCAASVSIHIVIVLAFVIVIVIGIMLSFCAHTRGTCTSPTNFYYASIVAAVTIVFISSIRCSIIANFSGI